MRTVLIIYDFPTYYLGIGENGERLSLRQHSQRLVLKSTPGEEVTIDHKDNISVEDSRRDSKTAGKAIVNKKVPPKKEPKSKDRAPRTKTEAALTSSSKKKQDQDRKKIGIILSILLLLLLRITSYYRTTSYH